MRILKVIHDFLPYHTAGSELYCFQLARELAARHTVRVLFTEVDRTRRQYSWRRTSYLGIEGYEVVHNHLYPTFEHTYADPQMDRVFEQVLQDADPDVVHIHHLLNHSINYIAIARRRGIPVVMTLHDYWLSCPNYGQRLKPGAGVCEEVEPDSCAACIARYNRSTYHASRALTALLAMRPRRRAESLMGTDSWVSSHRPFTIPCACQLSIGGLSRSALIVRSPARLISRRRLSAGARLRFSIGVGAETARRAPNGIRFEVRAGSDVLWARDLNPALRAIDRMWIDDQTTVPASADGHQLELAATPIGPMPHAGLVAAWAQVELSAPPDLVPGRLARGKHLLRAAGELCADPPAARAAKVRERTARILAATRDVELFLAPSAFMADRMQAFGIPAERIVCSQNGVRVDLLSVFRPRRSEQMRFGYVGAVSPHKGVHILMNAYRSVLDRVGPEGAELRIYGNLTWFPDYVAQLREMSRGTNVQFLGEFDNRNVAHVYEQFDVLVVPSIWWENAPTTIYEAALTRTPVLASDIGAMSNLVRPGLNGWLFRPGDAAHLAECMVAVVEGRTAVDALTYALPITSIATDAAQLERRYVDLFGNTVSASTPVAATP